jgi:hypothetical protein
MLIARAHIHKRNSFFVSLAVKVNFSCKEPRKFAIVRLPLKSGDEESEVILGLSERNDAESLVCK